MGNLTSDTALFIAEEGRKVLYGDRSGEQISTPKEALPDLRAIALPEGAWFKMEKALRDLENENNCLITYFEAG